jgi:hypothetical protein
VHWRGVCLLLGLMGLLLSLLPVQHLKGGAMHGRGRMGGAWCWRPQGLLSGPSEGLTSRACCAASLVCPFFLRVCFCSRWVWLVGDCDLFSADWLCPFQSERAAHTHIAQGLTQGLTQVTRSDPSALDVG